MGRGLPVCQQIREKIIEMFKNNVPQRKIGRDLDISPSTVHNIIKRFKEFGSVASCKLSHVSVQRRESVGPGLQPLRLGSVFY